MKLWYIQAFWVLIFVCLEILRNLYGTVCAVFGQKPPQMSQDTWRQHEVSGFDLFDQIRDLVCFSKRQITIAQHIIILADVGADGNTKF